MTSSIASSKIRYQNDVTIIFYFQALLLSKILVVLLYIIYNNSTIFFSFNFFEHFERIKVPTPLLATRPWNLVTLLTLLLQSMKINRKIVAFHAGPSSRQCTN